MTSFSTPQRAPRVLPVLLLAVFAALAVPMLAFAEVRDAMVAWVVRVVLVLVFLQGLLVVADVLLRRLRVDADGVLRVRAVLGGRATVDLSQLTAVRAEQRTVSRVGPRTPSRPVHIRLLVLRDAQGREATVEPLAWRDADKVLAAVRTAAAARGVTIADAGVFGREGA